MDYVLIQEKASAFASWASDVALNPYRSNVTPYKSSTGREFTQVFQHIPALEPFYFDFEKNWQAKKYVDFASATWPALPLAFIGAYALMIVLGTKFMEKRQKFDWKGSLALWNLGLCLFSFCGMVRTVPHLLHIIAQKNSIDTFCTPAEVAYGDGACGLWVMLFIFSKVPELGDTIFIVFRKTKLIFLHWYHHITVLLFCWHSYATQSSTGLYFVAMNYSVHAIMYGYYFLSVRKAVPKWFNMSWITVAQISQMIVGTYVCASSYYYMTSGVECDVKKENVIAGAIMYGSYLYLFCEFFVNRFIFGKKEDGVSKKGGDAIKGKKSSKAKAN